MFIERQWGRQTNGEGLSLARDGGRESGRGADCRPVPFAAWRRWVGLLGGPTGAGRRCARLAIGLFATWLLTDTVTMRVEAYVPPDNRPSRRSLESCGFAEEGLARSYIDGKHDAILYSLVRNDLFRP